MVRATRNTRCSRRADQFKRAAIACKNWVPASSSVACCVSRSPASLALWLPWRSVARSNAAATRVRTTAQVDAPCPINLVPHPYWNLDGHADVTTHQLWVNAHTYLPLNARELPEPPASVADTPFDYTTARHIRRADIPKLDAAYLIHRAASANHGNGLHVAARCEAGGLRLTVSTDRPFVHLYAAAGLAPQSAAEANGHAKPLGVAHQPGAGLCLETEDWPNGPANQREEVWYDAHRAYSHKARWQFTTL